MENEIPKTGFSQEHEARRYAQIHHVVDQMGGWANFRHWITKHGASYFETCSKLEEKISTLFEAIKHGDEKHQAWLKEAIEKHFTK